MSEAEPGTRHLDLSTEALLSLVERPDQHLIAAAGMPDLEVYLRNAAPGMDAPAAHPEPEDETLDRLAVAPIGVPPRKPEVPVVATVPLDPPRGVSRADLLCLAQNVYYEARGEPVRGQVAVAHVTLNRVARDDYPDTICGVVHQPWQFSWTNGHPPEIVDQRAWEIAVQVASDAVRGRPTDPTAGATHFYAQRLVADPAWSRSFTRIAAIYAHTFFRKD